jgi:hypothetical protein
MGHEHSIVNMDINFSGFRMILFHTIVCHIIGSFVNNWVWKGSRPNEGSLGTCLEGPRHSTKIYMIIGASPEIRIAWPFPIPTRHRHTIQLRKSRLRKILYRSYGLPWGGYADCVFEYWNKNIHVQIPTNVQFTSIPVIMPIQPTRRKNTIK